MAKFNCIECVRDFEEGESDKHDRVRRALCKPCCRAIVARIWFPEDEIVSVTDRMSEEAPESTPTPQEKPPLSKDIDWTEVQIEYGCSIASVCHHTKKASDSPKPAKVATRPRRHAGVRLVNVSAATSERYNALMDEFLAKRAEIDKAIEALKQLENYI